MERREGEPTQGGIMKKEELRQTPEEKEIEKLSPIALIYRDNDLFKEWIPKIAETLKSFGREVEIQSFPAGTGREEMEKWLEKNEDMIHNKDVVTDRTIKSRLPVEIRDDLKHQEHLGMLDNMLNEVTEKAILGKELDEIEIEGGRNLGSFKEAFSKTVKQILKNRDNVPKKVFIITDRLTDHGPFCKNSEFWREETPCIKILEKWMAKKDPKDLNSLKERLVEIGRSQEQAEYLTKFAEERADKRDGKFKDFKDFLIKSEMEPKAAKIVKESLVEGGVPANSIKISSRDYENKEDYWILADRHLHLSSPPYIKLCLPLGNFYWDAKEAGLIKVKPEELEKEVEEILKEKFGKKEEKE